MDGESILYQMEHTEDKADWLLLTWDFIALQNLIIDNCKTSCMLGCKGGDKVDREKESKKETTD